MVILIPQSPDFSEEERGHDPYFLYDECSVRDHFRGLRDLGILREDVQPEEGHHEEGHHEVLHGEGDGDKIIDEDYAQSDEEADEDYFPHKALDSDVEEEADDYVVHPGEAESDYGESDELDSVEDSSEEEIEEEAEVVDSIKKKRKVSSRKLVPPKSRLWMRDHDLLIPKLELGLKFANVADCREAIKEYSIKTGRQLHLKKNDLTRVLAVCNGKAEKPCPFRFYASLVNSKGGDPTVMVKSFVKKHICGRVTKNTHGNSTWMSKRFEDAIRSNPNITIGQFRKMVVKGYGIDVTRHQIYRAKNLAIKRDAGSMEEQYAKLGDYAHELLRRNPGSTVILKNTVVGDTCTFHRMYICLAALKNGFTRGCRKIFGVDGCHLKGPYKGQLLSAVGVDANNGMFPIAYAVVEIENRESWTWFLELFKEDIEMSEDGTGWVIITDKQKGLEQAIKHLMPAAEHRNCVRHLHENFKKDGHLGLALKQQLWAIARTTNIPWFKEEMDKMKVVSEGAYKWLLDKPAKAWSRSHFGSETKCDILLNNMCESFNKAILDARSSPILTMLEEIRTYLMLRMAKQRAKQWDQVVGPRIVAIVERSRHLSNSCICLYSGIGMYEIHHEHGRKFAVNLYEKKCDCRRWELTGIPCSHAMCALAWTQENPLESVDKWYTREMYEQSYKDYIAPMPDSTQWLPMVHAPILPPEVRVLPGRRKKNRTKQPDEIPKTATTLKRYNIAINCTRCKKEGHNTRTCPEIPVEERAARRAFVSSTARRLPNTRPGGLEPPSALTPRITRSSTAQEVLSEEVRQKIRERKEKAQELLAKRRSLRSRSAATRNASTQPSSVVQPERFKATRNASSQPSACM